LRRRLKAQADLFAALTSHPTLIDQLVERLGATATSSINGALDVVRAHLAIDMSSSLEDLSLLEPASPFPVAR